MAASTEITSEPLNRKAAWWKILAILAVTIFMFAGLATLDSGDSDGNTAFLPDGSELVEAQKTLAIKFPTGSGLISVQVIGRGDALQPQSIEGFTTLMQALANDPEINPYLADMNPIVSYSSIYMSLANKLGVPSDADPETVIQTALSDAETVETAQTLESLLARDATGAVVGGIGILTLNELPGQESEVENAQLRAEEFTEDYENLPTTESGQPVLDVRTLSSAKQAKESSDAQASSTFLLLGLALLVIMVLLAIFYRTFSDVLISLTGLALTIVWAFGFQSWLGPGGLGWLGANSPLVIMVPVILIGLCVDYALQVSGRYRDTLRAHQELQGLSKVRTAMTIALRSSYVPLGLASATTALSFFTNITSDIGPNRDFGVMAGLGVLSGLAIMLMFASSARFLLDSRRAKANKKIAARPLADSIPGLDGLFRFTARLTVQRPVAVLGSIFVITVVAFWGASNISTTFSSTEFSPEGAETTEDIEFLDEFVGGQTETLVILIETELSDDRSVRNLLDLHNDLSDPVSRPEGLTAEAPVSLISLVEDWTTPSGEPGDNYDPQFAQNFQDFETPLIIEPETVEQFFATLENLDPEGFNQLVSNNPNGIDHTILQVQAITGDTDRTRALTESLEDLWYGDPDEITAVAGEVLSVEILDEMVDSQTISIIITLFAATLLLVLFFGFTEFRPMLGVLTVIPVGLVLIWVLGTMTLLGISYNLITALITALTIGIGVDYTIHFTHRFLEESEHREGILEAITATKLTTGGALTGSALTTVLGFLVLILSPISAMGQFGIVTGITIFYSLVSTMVVLPPFLTLWALYHRWRATQNEALVSESISAAKTHY